MQKSWVWSLGQEDTLQKGMATLSSVLAWRIPWTEKLGGLQSMGSQRVRHDWATNTYLGFCYIYILKISLFLIVAILPLSFKHFKYAY